VQPLPTEASPRSVCAHCGDPLPPPNGSATFVYGVGAVGYQSCTSCGAKWRYLWQDSPAVRVKPDRSRRLVFLLGGIALVVLLVVGVIAFAQSKRWNRDEPARPTPSSTPATTPRSGPSTDLTVAALTYVPAADQMAEARASYMTWLTESATSTPQLQVNARTDAYVDGASAAIRQLEDNPWPDEVAGDVDEFVETARKFLDELEPVYSGQAGAPAYVSTITGEAAAVDAADAAVREKLGFQQDSE